MPQTNCSFGKIVLHNSTLHCQCFKGYYGDICQLNHLSNYWTIYHLILGWCLISMILLTMWLICQQKVKYYHSHSFNPTHAAFITMFACIGGFLQEILWHLADLSTTEYYSFAYIPAQWCEMLFFFFAFVSQGQMLFYWYTLMSFSPNMKDNLRKMKRYTCIFRGFELISDSIIRSFFTLFSLGQVGNGNTGNVWAMILTVQYVVYSIDAFIIGIMMLYVLNLMHILIQQLAIAPLPPPLSPSANSNLLKRKPEQVRIRLLLKLYSHALRISALLNIGYMILTFVHLGNFLIMEPNAYIDASLISLRKCAILLEIATTIWFLMQIHNRTNSNDRNQLLNFPTSISSTNRLTNILVKSPRAHGWSHKSTLLSPKVYPTSSNHYR